MHTLFRTATVAALLGFGLSTATLAQTPKLQVQPNLTLKWLNSLTISPATVPGGTSATGTVTLLRPAVAAMLLDLKLVNAIHTDSGVWLQDGNYVQMVLSIPAGSDRGTFSVFTTAESAPRTLTVEVRYGKEMRSASVSTTRPRTTSP